MIGIASLVIVYSLELSGFSLLLSVPIIITLAATELVYKDASEINREKGFKVIDATLWSLLVLLFWIVTLPSYIFVRRKEALTKESKVLQHANALGHPDSISSISGNQNFCPNCGRPTQMDAIYCSGCGSSLQPINSTS
jgi:hypothetical protein